MKSTGLPIVAGSVSTVIFAASYLPMLRKAMRTRDLSSYSPANLLLTNVGNAVHSLYVFSLPPGPVWALHTFYLATSALMLLWYARYVSRGRGRAESNPAPPPMTEGGNDVAPCTDAQAAGPGHRPRARRVPALA
jgi:hypothetical protein